VQRRAVVLDASVVSRTVVAETQKIISLFRRRLGGQVAAEFGAECAPEAAQTVHRPRRAARVERHGRVGAEQARMTSSGTTTKVLLLSTPGVRQLTRP